MREKVSLSCTTCLSRNHITEKNKQTQTHRIEMKKFCKHCNAHTLHRETK